MQKGSFKVVASFLLFFFLATPMSAFAQGAGGLAGLFGSGAQGGLDPMSLLLGGVLGGGLGGGGFGGAGAGGGGGGAGQVGQVLTLVGALTGNMGLLMAGMITSMLGGLAGGSTPQTGSVDEQYVSQGQSFGSGGSGLYSPYYPTPTPGAPSPTPAASACSATIFIVNDTTVNPNVTKPYPSTTSVTQNNCVLAINTDTVKQAVTIQPTSQTSGAALAITEVAPGASHIFRFSTKNTYKFCISPSACSNVTVQ